MAPACRKARNQVYNRGSPVLRTQEKGAQVKKTLPVLLLSLVFAVDCLAQTPARDPIQVAQAAGAAGGASQGVGASAGGAGVGSTLVAIVAVGVAAALAVATSNSTTTGTAANH
jgi:hypothetical protein